MNEHKVQTTLSLHRSIYDAAKTKASEDGISLSMLFEMGVAALLAEVDISKPYATRRLLLQGEDIATQAISDKQEQTKQVSFDETDKKAEVLSKDDKNELAEIQQAPDAEDEDIDNEEKVKKQISEEARKSTLAGYRAHQASKEDDTPVSAEKAETVNGETEGVILAKKVEAAGGKAAYEKQEFERIRKEQEDGMKDATEEELKTLELAKKTKDVQI